MRKASVTHEPIDVWRGERFEVPDVSDKFASASAATDVAQLPLVKHAFIFGENFGAQYPYAFESDNFFFPRR